MDVGVFAAATFGVITLSISLAVCAADVWCGSKLRIAPHERRRRVG
jgi:hypothetical protein